MPVERFNLEEGQTNILSNEHWLRYEAVAPLVKDKIVLDIACGSGYGTDYLAGRGAKEIIGADINEASIRRNQAYYHKTNLRFQTADALKLPFENNKFDLIISLETIEHFPVDKQDAFLKELKRVLKQDGLVVLSTPNAEASRINNPWHLKELVKSEFSVLLKDNFASSYLYEQGSALATFIKGNGETQLTITGGFQAKYYLALASDRDINEQIATSASLNPLALSVKENHPLMKAIDKVYYQLNKLSIFKKIFRYFSRLALKAKTEK